MKKTLTTCLWFDTQAEEAMQFYAALLPNSRMGSVQRHAADSPFGTKKGDVMAATALIMGQDFMALNGGPMFPQTEAVSFQIHCDTQEEVDHYWDSLISGRAAFDYTQRVAQNWGVGQKEKNNGAVLFVFVQDRKMFRELLMKVIESGDIEEYRLTNKLARHQAERLLKQEGEFFYD